MPYMCLGLMEDINFTKGVWGLGLGLGLTILGTFSVFLFDLLGA